MSRRTTEQIINEALKQHLEHLCIHEEDWGEVKETMRVIRETIPQMADDVKVNREAILVIKTEKKTFLNTIGVIFSNVVAGVALYFTFKE